MTDRRTAPGLPRRLTAPAWNALTSAFLFALVAAGLGGAALAGPSTATGHAPTLSLVSTQASTPIGTYTNSQATITVTKNVSTIGTNNVVAYVADVTVRDGTVLRSAFAKNQYGKNITEPVSTIAKNNNAVLAINTDFYGFRDDGIVIRNGTSYREVKKRLGAGIVRDGSMMLYDENTTSAAQLLAANLWQGFSFGPHLVRNGQIPSGIETYEIGDFGTVQPGAPGSIQGLQPRTGFGMISPNHFLLIVVDGRNAGGSKGVTMTQFAQMFIGLGATTAFNLDGGGSSTMFFNGTVVNTPAFLVERATSDILYIAR